MQTEVSFKDDRQIENLIPTKEVRDELHQEGKNRVAQKEDFQKEGSKSIEVDGLKAMGGMLSPEKEILELEREAFGPPSCGPSLGKLIEINPKMGGVSRYGLPKPMETSRAYAQSLVKQGVPPSPQRLSKALGSWKLCARAHVSQGNEGRLNGDAKVKAQRGMSQKRSTSPIIEVLLNLDQKRSQLEVNKYAQSPCISSLAIVAEQHRHSQ